MKRLALLVCALLAIGLAALAQSEAQSDSGFLVRQLENSLSAPGRIVRFQGTSGIMTSRARVERITLADDRGVWLELQNVALDWSRLQLLRARVRVDSLRAENVVWQRRAEPPAAPRVSLPAAETTPFSLPQLPVSIDIRDLRIDRMTFAAPVFGQAADLAIDGSIQLARGVLDSNVHVVRLDGPGGTLALRAGFSNETRILDLDLDLQEPKDGLVATLLRIEGRPPIRLKVAGRGPLENLDVTLALDADGKRLVNGTVALDGTDAGLAFNAALNGNLAPLVPPQFRTFFAEGSVTARGLRDPDGALRIDEARIVGPILNVDGRLSMAPGGLLTSLDLTGTLGDPTKPPVVLPVPGGDTRVNSATIRVNFGSASTWDGFLVLDRFETGGIRMEDATLAMGGRARDLADPEKRDVTMVLEGLATGVGSDDPRIAAALGPRLDLFADATLPAEAPIQLKQLQVGGNGLALFAAGTLKDLVFTGRGSARVADLAILSGLTGRDTSGSLRLNLDGSVSPLTRGFDLTFDGESSALKVGNPRLDGLLAGETVLSGRAVRDETGFRTEDLRLDNPQISLTSDGIYSSARTDIGFEARINDLARADPRAAGALTLRGNAAGGNGEITVVSDAAMPEGALLGREVAGLALAFNGKITGSDRLDGNITGGGSLGGEPLGMAGSVAIAGRDRSLSGLRVTVGPNVLTGDLAQTGDAPITGALSVAAPDVAPVAALALREASGSVDADIRLSADGTRQDATVTAQARDLAAGTVRVADLGVDMTVTDLRGVPMAAGTVTGTGIAAGGVDIASVNLVADAGEGQSMAVEGSARLTLGTLVDLSARLARQDGGGFAATLDTLSLRQQGMSAILSAPATLTMANGTTRLTPLTLDFGTGRLTAQGSAGADLDLALDLQTLPVAIANAVRPDLGLTGDVTGTARMTGARTAPNVTFDVTAAGVGSALGRSNGLPPLDLRATGRSEGRVLTVDARVTGGGLSGAARGSVPLGAGNLDLAVELNSFPLAIVDRLAGRRGVQGSVTGTARVTGPLASPQVGFDLAGERLGVTASRNAGVPPIDVTASGAFAGNAVTLTRTEIRGAGGLALNASGRIPLAGPGLDLRFDGTLPLTLADALLAHRAAQATGTLRLSGTASGSLQAPRLAGEGSVAGGTYADPGLNLRLQDVALDIGFEGDTVRLRSGRANVVGGGAVTANGQIALNPGAGFPTDFDVQMRGVRYTDGAFVTTVVTADLALNGAIQRTSTLSGRIDLGPTEISISEGLGGGSTAIVDQVEHLRPPPRVQDTLARARVDEERGRSSGSGRQLAFDLRIRAPNQIFVRGRGLDAEVGGEMQLQGVVGNLQPVGQFDLRRGQLVLGGQRIEFTEGSLTWLGDLDPRINFVAQSRSEDVTAYVTVTGRASEPEIVFSSDPPLPQDEVLSRLLFNRATQSLSPFQAAQLASTAAELSGRGGPSILSQLRSSVGLDDLDVITTDTGGTAVRAGKYLDDNIYLDLQTGSDGVSRAEIVLDLNDKVTARGSVSSDGESTVGIFYQRDY